MKNENIAPDLIWVDEVFAKGPVDDLEAACCLAGYNEEDEEIKLSNVSTPAYIIINSPEIVRKIYGIVKTWPKFTNKAPLLWYIWQAVVRSAPHVRYDLLFPKCKEKKFRQKECVDKYPELAERLGLLDLPTEAELQRNKIGHQSTITIVDNLFPNEMVNEVSMSARAIDEYGKNKNEQLSLPNDHKPTFPEIDKYPWVPSALKVFKEFNLEKSNLSLEQKAEKVHKEMQKKLDESDKGMAKRGGKKAPSSGSIRRHALEGL